MHRLNMLKRHVAASDTNDDLVAKTFTVIDNRSGKDYLFLLPNTL